MIGLWCDECSRWTPKIENEWPMPACDFALESLIGELDILELHWEYILD